MKLTKQTAGYWLTMLGMLGVLLTGCATMEGAGKDIQSAGEGIEDAAQDASN